MPADQPLVVISRSGAKRWVSAADTAAYKLGLRVGMPASKAQAVIAGLTIIDADPAADAAAVERLALWALRQFTPVVAIDGADGVVMDTEGSDHLRGGEEMLISGLVNSLRGRGLTARAAVADTWGAAHALSRFTAHHLRDMLNEMIVEQLVSYSAEPGLLPRVRTEPHKGKSWSQLTDEALAELSNDRDVDVRYSAQTELDRRGMGAEDPVEQVTQGLLF